MKPSTRQRDRARVAAMLSGVVMPGAGQIYNGQRWKGLFFGAVEILVLVAFSYLAVAYARAYIARVVGAGEVQDVAVPAVAQALGGHWIALAVAWAANPLAPIIPCHRVVRSDGSLGGYSAEGGLALKRLLLEREGVSFDERGRVRF